MPLREAESPRCDATLVVTEAATLPDFFTTVERQAVLPREIVVVDGGSAEGTLEALEGWQSLPGLTVRIVSSPGAGISRGSNEAISRASQDGIAITDAGTQLDPIWLELLRRLGKRTRYAQTLVTHRKMARDGA